MSADILGTSWDECWSMVQYSFTSTETSRLVRTDSPGRPLRISHSSWSMIVNTFQKVRNFRFSHGCGCSCIVTGNRLNTRQHERNIKGFFLPEDCLPWRETLSLPSSGPGPRIPRAKCPRLPGVRTWPSEQSPGNRPACSHLATWRLAPSPRWGGRPGPVCPGVAGKERVNTHNFVTLVGRPAWASVSRCCWEGKS